jgi:DegV family protein with EDD domain
LGRIAVIADSIANLPPDIVKQYGVRIVPINILFGRKRYRDGVDLTASEAYRMLEEKPDQFFSSPASIGEYVEVFKEAARGAEGLLCITLSTKLSGMFNVAVLAQKQVQERSITIPIEVLDSRNAAAGEGLIVTAAAKAAKAGKSLSEVKEITRAVSDKVNLLGVLETIRYVYRTGRVTKLTARFGSMLNIHPMITIKEGSVRVTSVTKNQESGMARIMKQMKKEVRDRPVHVAIAHADASEAGEKLKEKIRSEYDCAELWLTDFSPVMAYATGTGVIVVAYYTEESVLE